MADNYFLMALYLHTITNFHEVARSVSISGRDAADMYLICIIGDEINISRAFPKKDAPTTSTAIGGNL